MQVEMHTLGSETSQYQVEQKPKKYFLSSGERKGRSPNLPSFFAYVQTYAVIDGEGCKVTM